MRINLTEKRECYQLALAWKSLRHSVLGLTGFKTLLMSHGWLKQRESVKMVFVKGRLVVKFDGSNCSRSVRQHHTWGEWCRWGSAKTLQKRHMAAIVLFCEGLIFQERVAVADIYSKEPPRSVVTAALKVRTSHYWDCQINPIVKFFDYDSRGPGSWTGTVGRAYRKEMMKLKIAEN